MIAGPGGDRLLGGVLAALAATLLATAPAMAVRLAPLDGDRPGLSGLLAALMALAGVGLVLG